MSGTFIFVIAILAGITFMISGIIWLASLGIDDDVPGYVPCIAGLICLLCGGWLFAASQCELKVDREVIAKSATVNDVQCVVFADGLDTYHYNLNKEFGRTFEDGTEFKLIFYSSGPYAGLHMDYTEDMEQVK
jgi:hypothetical protein